MRGIRFAVQLKFVIALIGISNPDSQFTCEYVGAETAHRLLIKSSLRITASAISFMDFRLCRLSFCNVR